MIRMLFQDGSIISFKSYDHVAHSVLESGMVKEGSISFPLFKPINSGLLLPKHFFLFIALIKVNQKIIFFGFNFSGVPNIHNAMLHSFQFIMDGLFVFENFAESTFIPFRKVRPENMKLLMHARHFETSCDLHVGPPFFHSTIKGCII